MVELLSYFFLVNHLYDYRPNWTPLSPITIINRPNTRMQLLLLDIYYITNVKCMLNVQQIFTIMCQCCS